MQEKYLMPQIGGKLKRTIKSYRIVEKKKEDCKQLV